MVLLRTRYWYGGFLEYHVKLQFSAFWSIYGKTLSWENANFMMYPSPKKHMNHLQKKIRPPYRPLSEKSRTQKTQLNFQIFIICFNNFEQKSSYDLLIEFVYECNESNLFKF